MYKIKGLLGPLCCFRLVFSLPLGYGRMLSDDVEKGVSSIAIRKK